MIRSMTGFGAAEGDVAGTRVTVEIRAVNHRFFNPSVKLPGRFARWETDVREAMRRTVVRGHVTLSARSDRAAEREGAIDEVKFAGYVTQLRELQERHALHGGVDLATVLRLPDVFATGGVEVEEPGESDGPQLVAIVERALAALNAMRDAEGARLRLYLLERLAVVEDAVARIDARSPARLIEQRDRLRANVQSLAAGVAIDDARLAQEIAILADRLDISEELSRFRSHFVAFREALSGHADGAGKRLGFLLQELLRETNTTGSKGNDGAIVQDVLLIKEELERIREQVENLE